jgi:hypothetical protein
MKAIARVVDEREDWKNLATAAAPEETLIKRNGDPAGDDSRELTKGRIAVTAKWA